MWYICALAQVNAGADTGFVKGGGGGGGGGGHYILDAAGGSA